MHRKDSAGCGEKRPAVITIGAGRSQLPLIHKARKMEWSVVAVDRNPQAPGFAMADACVVRSTFDIEAVVTELQGLRDDFAFVGVVARVSGSALYTAAAVASTFGLRGLSASVVRLATEKSALRDFFHQRGLPMPQGVAVSNQEELPEKLTFPVVVKPDLPLVGKKAVRLVRERTDLALRVREACKASENNRAEIACFVPGFDIACLCYTDAGRVSVITWWDELVACDVDGLFIGLGASVPSVIVGTPIEGKAASIVQQLMRNFPGVQSLLLVSFRVSMDGSVHVIELHADLGGDLIADVLLPTAAPDFDFFGIAIEVATGNVSAISPPQLAPTALYYLPQDMTAGDLPDLELYLDYALARKSSVMENLTMLPEVNKACGRSVSLGTAHVDWLSQQHKNAIETDL